VGFGGGTFSTRLFYLSDITNIVAPKLFFSTSFYAACCLSLARVFPLRGSKEEEANAQQLHQNILPRSRGEWV